MPLTIIADFFDFINLSLFDTTVVLLIVSFIIWEIPRSIKIISEEYTKGLYPSNGRVVDFFLFAVGIITIIYYLMDNNSQALVNFLHTPGITGFFLILMITVPLIIILGYFKRFFERIEAHNSVTVFLTHSFLDLMHTIFFVCLATMVIPTLGLLLIGSG